MMMNYKIEYPHLIWYSETTIAYFEKIFKNDNGTIEVIICNHKNWWLLSKVQKMFANLQPYFNFHVLTLQFYMNNSVETESPLSYSVLLLHSSHEMFLHYTWELSNVCLAFRVKKVLPHGQNSKELCLIIVLVQNLTMGLIR